MNCVMCYTLVALVIFMQEYECIETNKQQVKLIGIIVHYCNPKYVQNVTYAIEKKNDTYNNLRFRYNVTKNFPEDIRLQSTVYVTDSSYENSRLLLKDDTPVRKGAKNYDLLPLVFVYIDKNGRKYNDKGINEQDDIGQFRFEILTPNLDKIGKYYKANYKLVIPDGLIYSETYYSEWGFLNN